MIEILKNTLKSPRGRLQAILLASAGLIGAGLLARFGFGAEGLHDVLMTAAALIAGTGIALRAFRSLRSRHISIELLVTIAATGALIIGEVWEAAAVTFLFVLGAYLEMRTLSRTRQVLAGLLDLAPVTALVLRDGRQVEVSPQDVAPGETVLVKPGAKVPVDGEVISGASAVDESMITGEPMPEEKIPGAPVFAGTINLEGMLQVKVTGSGHDTTLARIIARVEEAQEEKAPTQRFVEKFSTWYTPAIVLLSLGVYAVTRNIELSLTLLVIACPGALVISTPVSVIAGIGQAARQGILIKGGEYLENSGRVSVVAMDKTGTLTYGRPELADIFVLEAERSLAGMPDAGRPAGGASWSLAQQEVLFWAGLAESSSEHPLARAVTLQAEKLHLLPVPERFVSHTGKGIEAEHQGRVIRVGKPDWLVEEGLEIPARGWDEIRRLRSLGATAVGVGLDGEVTGILGIRDRIRPEAAQALKELSRAGVREVIMLTGDDELTARAVAAEAGITHVRAGLLPEEKLQVIRELQAAGNVVAMVGDGINDAPALAAADLGIAMGAAGSGIAIETADIALMADDLNKVAEAIRLSRATLRNIRQNLAVALLTVSFLLVGVLFDRVHMAGGMLVHQGSVLLVILNGMRLLKKED
jgi:Zn2+/Cd2+-exporting ATPase